MIIQGLTNHAFAYSATYKPSVERQDLRIPATDRTDKVSISDAAKALLSGSNDIPVAKNEQASGTREGSHLRWQQLVINDAREFPGWGEKFTHDFAYDDGYQTNGPLVDISNLPTMRYTYTGEVVTEKNLADFKAEAATARIGRIALYEAEKAKGTPDAEILEKMFRYTDTQSDSYLNIVGWERANAGMETVPET